MTTVRILPVGDSITQGQNTSYGSYRRHLYELMVIDNIDVLFVGPYSDGSFPSPAHDGVSGDVINGAWGRIAGGHIETYTPDIILLLIGTNDILGLGGGSVSTPLGTYSSLLDSIATHGPAVRTIVGALPPINASVAGSTVSSNVNVFNTGLNTLVASKGANFSFANINAGITTSDLADGIHPTDAGNDKMAPLWYTAYQALFNSFTLYSFPATGVSATRTLPDRLLDVVNVWDYGAVGDGVTDDWEAIMAALSWNSIFVEAAAKVYSAAVRFTSLTWSSGTATAVTAVPHGLTTGDVIFHWITAQTDGADWTGQFTVTVGSDPYSFTYPIASKPGRARVPLGCFTAHITNATWSANVVTVNFGAPHRMVDGITANVYGFSDGMDGSRVITVTGPKQLRFPFTGSGSPTVVSYGWISQPPVLVVTRWPGVPEFATSGIHDYYMAEEYPTNYAGNYFAQIFDVTGNTITFGSDFYAHFFLNSIEAGAAIRLSGASFGKIYFPPGEYKISQTLSLGHVGVSGIFYGSPGNSIIHGSFPAYLMSQDRIGHGPARWEGLSFINDDPEGGGLRLVGSTDIVSGCTFSCGDVGLSLSNDDSRNDVAFETEVTGCMFFANGDVSVGLADSSNSSQISGNYFHGLANGILAQNFFHCTDGNSFVDCEIGYNGGANPFGESSFTNEIIIRGNTFTNCGIGLFASNIDKNRIEGIYIVGGADAEYGFGAGVATGVVRGLYATGDFSVAAIRSQNASPPRSNKRAILRSLGALNTGAGDAWELPLYNGQLAFDNCDIIPTFSYADLNGRSITGTPTYNSGTGVVTLTTNTAHNIDTGNSVFVSGVKVSGSTDNSYNGIYTALSASGSTVTYHVDVAPGTATANTGSITTCGTSSSARPIKAIAWNSGTHIVAVESLTPHGMLKYGSTAFVQAVVGGSYSNGFNAGSYVPVTVIDSTNFTYAGPSTSPGTVDPTSLSTSLPSNSSSTASFFYAAPHAPGAVLECEEGYSTSNISDGQKLGTGTANIGDIVTASGSQRIGVVWTQNGWMRRG